MKKISNRILLGTLIVAVLISVAIMIVFKMMI